MKRLPSPGRERATRVPLRARRRDHRVPVVDRLLEPLARRRRALDRTTGVLLPVARQRPAVVLAALEQVQLVAAARAVVDRPEAALAVEGERLHVALADGPDLGARIGAAGERVVGRDRTVGRDPDRLAQVAVEALRIRSHPHVGAFAGRHVEHAVGAEREARAVVHGAVEGRQHAEDHADLIEAAAVVRQHAARDAGAVAAVARLGVAPEDRAVRSERRAQRDVEQPALAARIDRRHAGDRLARLGRRPRRCAGARRFSVTRKSPPGSGSSAQG